MLPIPVLPIGQLALDGTRGTLELARTAAQISSISGPNSTPWPSSPALSFPRYAQVLDRRLANTFCSDGIHKGTWQACFNDFRRPQSPLRISLFLLLNYLTMKPSNTIRTSALLLAGACLGIQAAINVPSDGSDGALTITTNTVIDLGQAVTAPWNAENSANAGKGVYDTNKWAVVFKYSSVTIAPGATLTFANHPSRAPVVWLVEGNVTIDGSVSLDGHQRETPPRIAEPGPGGFRGGFGSFAVGVGQGPGFGPGGGQNPRNGDRYGGSFGSLGYGGSVTYGNPSLVPLIGGSGGSGDSDFPGSSSGGGGGGAILIACSGDLILGSSGTIRANGGNGGAGEVNNHSAGGSGGGIRLVCDTLSGNGVVNTLAGTGYRSGGLGRIRIERATNAFDGETTPDPSVVPLQAGATPLIWLPENGPLPAPADPRASFGAYGPDVALPQASTVPVIVETTNAEEASVVTVRVTPRANGSYTETVAGPPEIVTTSPLVLRWTANVPVNGGYSAVQVKVQRP